MRYDAQNHPNMVPTNTPTWCPKSPRDQPKNPTVGKHVPQTPPPHPTPPLTRANMALRAPQDWSQDETTTPQLATNISPRPHNLQPRPQTCYRRLTQNNPKTLQVSANMSPRPPTCSQNAPKDFQFGAKLLPKTSSVTAKIPAQTTQFASNKLT